MMGVLSEALVMKDTVASFMLCLGSFALRRSLLGEKTHTAAEENHANSSYKSTSIFAHKYEWQMQDHQLFEEDQ